MKSAPSPARIERTSGRDCRAVVCRRAIADSEFAARRRCGRAARAFTLVEILAALLMMAIIIPVAMEGMSIATRAGVLGQRKATAMRVAERVLNEMLVEGDTSHASTGGSTVDGDTTYAYTMRSENWPEDPMMHITVTVTFTVQGNDYTVDLSTLIPPSSADLDAMGASTATTQ